MRTIINHPTRTLLSICERLSKHVSEDAIIIAYCVASVIAALVL